jgi:hypothetical protein
MVCAQTGQHQQEQQPERKRKIYPAARVTIGPTGHASVQERSCQLRWQVLPGSKVKEMIPGTGRYVQTGPLFAMKGKNHTPGIVIPAKDISSLCAGW